MTGQEALIKKLHKIENLDDLPKSIVITGNKGMGKHTFTNEIMKYFFTESCTEEIDYELTLDILNDMYALSIPRLYVIDLDKAAEHKRVDRFQNTLLKFIEEPPMFAWIVILASDENFLIETIRNRCQIWSLAPYSLEELSYIAWEYGKEFTDDELRILDTPGNVVKYDKEYLNKLLTLSTRIIESISTATPANTLSLEKYFFGDEAFDFEIFIRVFKYFIMKKYLEGRYDDRLYNVIIEAGEFDKRLKLIGINKQHLFDNFILRVKACMK